MRMIVNRVLHPVGHGAFFTEQFYDYHTCENVMNVVYDCGVRSNQPLLEQEIDGTFAGSNRPHVDFLFISHLDKNKAGYYLHTYRGIDALNVLMEAHRMMEGQSVHWRVRTAVLKNTGQAYIQLRQYEKGLACFAQSYDIIEDGDDKAAAAGHLAGCFLRDGRFEEAMKWADKEISE